MESEFKLRDLLQYCEEKKKIPIEQDEVFCGDYEYKFDKYNQYSNGIYN